MDNSFKTFFYSKNAENKDNVVATQLHSVIANKVEAVITSDFRSIGGVAKKVKFSSEVAGVASSHEVISELSDKLGKPLLNETEDEFVARGKEELKAILLKKFNVKK